jgi:hypothetical protein
MLENPGRLIWIRDGAYEEHMIYNRANGVIAKMEYLISYKERPFLLTD